MRFPHRVEYLLGLAFLASLATAALRSQAQPISPATAQPTAPVNSAPNPYRSVENWARMPEGRTWGSSAGVYVDPTGTSVWVAERCGANSCAASELAPILRFDMSGRLLKAFGAGMFVFPHGIFVDQEGNVWVTDGLGKDGKGHQVFKFSPEGKVLLALGKAGVAGAGLDEFNAPSSVLVAPNGDIFVGDGHGVVNNQYTNARIVKFNKDGKFIKTWGMKGSAPGDIDIPHALAMDSRGRLFLGDRQNNRIQIFDQNGTFLDQWSQFSRPSGIFIDKNDTIYVADSESESVSKNHDGWKRGIRIGRVQDGVVTGFIPDPVEKATGSSAAEGVAADPAGNIYGAEVGPKRLMKYVKN
jgi:DNA-binding beta-propeller fold protein YncE